MMTNQSEVIKFINLEWDSKQLGYSCGLIDCSFYLDCITQPHIIKRINDLLIYNSHIHFTTIKVSCFYNDLVNNLVKRTNCKLIDSELIFKHNQSDKNIHIRTKNGIKVKFLKKIDPTYFFPLLTELKWSRYLLDKRITKEYSTQLWKNSLINHCFGRADDIAVAYINEKPSGLVLIMGTKSTYINLFLVGVLKEYQRKGVGLSLISSVLEKYKNTSIISVETSCCNTPAQQLYQKCGFSIDTIRYILHIIKR